MLHILLVEDEKRGIDICCQAIRSIVPDCHIIVAVSAEEAFVKMMDARIDVFFLDVKLPGMDGFRFAECIRGYEQYTLTPIVFITGYRTNHLRIHRRYHHYEYIEKPYTIKSFKASVSRLLITLDRQQQGEVRTGDEKSKLVPIRNGTAVLFVKYDDILFAETLRRTVFVHTCKESYKCSGFKLNEFISYVDEPSFLRCHKSYAVNAEKIRSVEEDGRYRWKILFEESLKTCDMGSAYYKSVMKYFSEMVGRRKQKAES